MANYSIRADLLKVPGAFVTNIKGRETTKKCLCIPLDGGMVYPGEKGVYLNLTAIEMREPKFSDTHCIKIDLDKQYREMLTEEQQKNMPILGGLHEIARKQTVDPFADAPTMQGDADLPF